MRVGEWVGWVGFVGWPAIMGPSGAGKTALLHCIMGKTQATGGRVSVNGAAVDVSQYRSVIGCEAWWYGAGLDWYAVIDLTMQVRAPRRRPPHILDRS